MLSVGLCEWRITNVHQMLTIVFRNVHQVLTIMFRNVHQVLTIMFRNILRTVEAEMLKIFKNI